MSKQIKIITSIDNAEFNTTTQLIQRSGFIKGLLDQFPDESQFDIPNIKGSIMTLIVEWLEKHKDNEPKIPPQPLRNYDLEEVVGKWESDYMERVFNKSFDNLFEFLNAVNFLDIPALLELASAKTACLIKDFNPEEFKKLFKIEEDCTSEDLKKIEEEVLKEREEEREKERQRLEKAEKDKELENTGN
jgi:S-phase kinase-associated protein 1